MHERPHVVVLGGGFGGLTTARALSRAPVRVTVIDRRNHHLFQPLLYQVATAGLAAPSIAAPIRKILQRQKNTAVLLAEAHAIDLKAKKVELGFQALAYDYLVVATGAAHSYFGHDEWEQYAPALKTVDDAFEIRRRVLLAYEMAEREADPEERRRWLTFVVVGAGPTGVELAGALAELSRHTLVKEFHAIDPRAARVVLVDAAQRILPQYPEELSLSARTQLERLGVQVQVGMQVTAIDATGVTFKADRLAAHTVLWGAGVAASPLGSTLGTERDRAGRVVVGPDLSLPGHPEVFVIGDLALVKDDKGNQVPGVAPAAIQGGQHVARQIQRTLKNRPREFFHYRDKGMLATIGRRAAVAQIGSFRASGIVAWWLWLVVHILYLIGFRNRLAVLFDWGWAYLTYDRAARIILERPRAPRSG